MKTSNSSSKAMTFGPAGVNTGLVPGLCNPSNPKPAGLQITLNVTGFGGDPPTAGGTIIVGTNRIICGRQNPRSYTIRFEDNVTFHLPDDLHWTTLAMLNGIALFFMQNAQWGEDREP